MKTDALITQEYNTTNLVENTIYCFYAGSKGNATFESILNLLERLWVIIVFCKNLKITQK